MEITEYKKQTRNTVTKEKSDEMIRALRKRDEQMVNGLFEFIDAQGGWIEFSYRFYPGEPLRTVKIAHGEIVDVPRHLMIHLNNTYKKVRYLDENLDSKGKRGVPTKFNKISRIRFIPLNAIEPIQIPGMKVA